MTALARIRIGRNTTPPGAAAGTTIAQLALGAGGWLTGGDISPDGVQVARTDTYGAYVRASAAQSWTQCVTTLTMPAADSGMEADGDLVAAFDAGCYEICIAPSDSTRIYMMFNGRVYRSSDRGANWTRTAFTQVTLQPNGTHRMNGPRMAVHPTNKDIVICGTPDNGAFYTTDAGANWSATSGNLNPTTSGPGFFCAFDPANGNTVYLGSDGRGVYRSTTGVSGTFALTTSGPSSMRRMAAGADSVLWVSDRTNNNNNLWRFSAGAWTNTTASVGGSGDYFHSIAPDPNNAGHVYAAADDGNSMMYTANNGTSFTATFQGTRVTGAGQPGWHANTNEAYMSNGTMMFDKSLSNKLFFFQGIGCWNCTPPTSATSFNWNADSIGVEQLVVNKIISPPGGSIVVSCWDRPIFKISDPAVYPTNHGINYTNSIEIGWSCDYSTADPNTIVVMATGNADQFGISSNGGTTWGTAVYPQAGQINGGLAASSPMNYCVAMAGSGGRVKFTTDSGATWNNATATGLPTSGETGLGDSTSAHRQIICADRVTANCFYFYANGTAASNASAGLWKSTDSGANFTKVFSGRMPVSSGASDALLYSYGANNAVLDSVPGKAGHLFYTSGDIGNNVNLGDFMRSTDAGTSWAAVPNVTEVKAFGFGKAKTGGGGYPTIYIVGFVSAVWGLWRSVDGELATPTWTQLTDWPLGRFDEVTTVCGDNNTYGRCYIGYRGSGAIYGDFP